MKRFLLGPLQLDAGQRVLYRDGEIIALSPKSFDILLVLVENAGQVVSRETIREKVWKDAFIEDANITNNISQLRNLLRQHLGSDPIRTLSKRGYQLIADVVAANEEEPPSEEFVPSRTNQNLLQHPLNQSTAPKRSPWLRIALASVLLLAVVSATTFLGLRHRVIKASVPPSLAVMQFRNLAISHDEDWMGTALEETVGAEMARDSGVRLISGERTAEVEQDLKLSPTKVYSGDVLKSLGKRLDCDFILSGYYVRVDDQVRIDMHLQNAKTGTIVREFSSTVTANDILQTAANAASDLRKAVGVTAAPPLVENADMDNSLDGLRFYAEGLRLLREDKAAGAAQILGKAVEVSPQSAQAHAALATAWNQLGFDQKAADEARLALNTSGSLPRMQKQVLQAGAYECLNDWPHALQLYTTLHDMYPDDLDYVLGISRAQIELGKAKDVLQMLDALKQSSADARNDPRISLQEADAASQLSDHRSQLLYAGEAVRLADAISARHLEARALISEGFAWDYMGDNHRGLDLGHQAEEIAEQIGNNRDLTAALSEEGQIERAILLPEAEPTLQRAYGLAEAAGTLVPMSSLMVGLGDIRELAEDWQGARQDYQKALDIDEEMKSQRREVVALIGLAQVAANTDAPESERGYAQRAQTIAAPMGDLENLTFTYEELGDVAEREGNLSEAKHQLEQGIDVARRSGNPDRIGFLLQDMLRLQIQLGDLAAARQLQQQVLGMNSGNIYIRTASKVDEARLDLEEGHPEQVIVPMIELATQITKIYPATEAWRLVAAADLTKGDTSNARAAINKAMELARKSPNTASFLLPDSLVAARVDAAQGQTAKAMRECEALFHEAQRLNNPQLQLEAKLAKAEFQKRPGAAGPDTHLLQSVKLEASQKGFGLIAQKANADIARV